MTEITVNFNRSNGLIRRLNGANLGPKLYGQTFGKRGVRPDMDNLFRELEIPLKRLHVCPLDNPGLRLVDIQHIFSCSFIHRIPD